MKPTFELHKLPEGFIVTSDEEIKEYDKILCLEDMKIDYATDRTNHHRNLFLKVIAQQDQIDLSGLLEEEQKKIGWFDVE